MLAISETWLDSSDSDDHLAIGGYPLFRRDRGDRAGGGVCFYILDSNPANIDVQFSCPDVELLWVRLHLRKRGSGLLVGCVYRPPSADASFWTKVEELLEGAEGEEILLLGDLNVDFLQPDSASFAHLKRSLLLPLDLTNLITEPTRFSKNGHSSLDVLLTNTGKLHSGSLKDCDLSDHCLVTAHLDCDSTLSRNFRPSFFRRDFRQFDPDTFPGLLRNSSLSHFESDDVNAMWSEWSGKFLEVLDVVAPMKCYTPKRKKCPFMTAELLQLIHQRRPCTAEFVLPTSRTSSYFNSSSVCAVKPTTFIAISGMDTSMLHVRITTVSLVFSGRSLAV